jgi:coatomer subunit beta
MQTFIAAESDPTCKRNAFVFLAHCAMPKAVEWISSIYDQIAGFDELLQMSIIEVIRLDCKNDSAHRVSGVVANFSFLLKPSSGSLYPMHIRPTKCLFACCQIRSRHHTYDFDAKSSCSERFVWLDLVAEMIHPLTSPVPAAASCFVNLVVKESDNNVKLIVLDRLDALRSKHGAVLEGLNMDVLQVLSRFAYSTYSLRVELISIAD